MQADQLIRELLATGTINDDTAADLNRMQAEFAAGTLHPDDDAYIRALHARVTSAPLPEPEPEIAAPVTLEGLSIGDWRDRALAAEAELADLRATTIPSAP